MKFIPYQIRAKLVDWLLSDDIAVMANWEQFKGNLKSKDNVKWAMILRNNLKDWVRI